MFILDLDKESYCFHF